MTVYMRLLPLTLNPNLHKVKPNETAPKGRLRLLQHVEACWCTEAAAAPANPQPPCNVRLCLQEPPSGVALLQPAAVGVTAPLRLPKATAAGIPPHVGHPCEPLAAMQLVSWGIRL
jgi:hypothetical protein